MEGFQSYKTLGDRLHIHVCPKRANNLVKLCPTSVIFYNYNVTMFRASLIIYLATHHTFRNNFFVLTFSWNLQLKVQNRIQMIYHSRWLQNAYVTLRRRQECSKILIISLNIAIVFMSTTSICRRLKMLILGY